VIRDPFRGASDLDRLREVDPKRDLGYVLEAVRRIRKALRPDVPLIGFAGAPFTLASYLIEGGGSKGHEKAKALLKDAEAWDPLMTRLTAATQSYLNAQVEAGAQAVQLFDSWVGVVTPEEYKSRILPYLQLLIRGLKKGVPVIYFGLKTAPFFPFLKETGATVIGVDGRQPLDAAWKALGNVAVQGTLDPEVLLTDPATVRAATEKVLELAGGRPGHIFNLGHGILPDTPMQNVRAMIETVKDWKTH
jgi:uroporphyrinogen decarboxylase